MKTIGVLTSGGDAPGMNAAIRAVVKAAAYNNIKVIGIERGYKGLINGEFKHLTPSVVEDIIDKGGTILKTARSQEFMTDDGQKKALNVLDILGIEGLIVIGGEGSFKGASKLNRLGVKIVAIPATIDNDLGYTDYSIGFDTTLNIVIDCISKVRDTTISHEKATIIEVMGRYCGDIALYAGIAGGAKITLIPEKGIEVNSVYQKLLEDKAKGNLNNIIILAENLYDPLQLKKEIEEKTGINTRVTMLGFIQRGGSPSAFDRILASRMGAKSITLLVKESTSKAIGIRGNFMIDVDIDDAIASKKELNVECYELLKEFSII